jgi:hypothetical protein
VLELGGSLSLPVGPLLLLLAQHVGLASRPGVVQVIEHLVEELLGIVLRVLELGPQVLETLQGVRARSNRFRCCHPQCLPVSKHQGPNGPGR